MARQIRILVSWKTPSAPPRDAFTNTLYYQDEALTPTNYDQLAEDVAEVYRTAGIMTGCNIETRAYDMADAEPRPIKGQATRTADGVYPNGDPEVATCLSYFGDRNLPSTRGRIYIGPWSAASIQSRPTQSVRTAVLELGENLLEIGGENISWRVHSIKTGEYHHIRTIWTNDEWDVLRSRGLRETVRESRPV